MFKLDFKKAEEPEIKLPSSSQKQESSRKTSTSAFIDYAKTLDCVDHNKLWKILKEMGIPDHLTCLLRNLYAVQEAIVRTGHGSTDWFQTGKGVYLRLLIVLPAILIPASASSSPAFLMMYSAEKLNKQGGNIQP